MKRNILVLLLVLVSVLGASAAYFAYHEWYIVDTFEVDIFFRVRNDSVGFAANRDILHFGKLQQGGISNRQVKLQTDVDVLVYFDVSLPFGPWVSAAENPYFLLAGEPDTIWLTLSVPADAQIGDYNGTLTTTYVRKTSWN